MSAKECLECGHQIFGRADKKFCSDACRSTFNNRARPSLPRLVQKINKTLIKNWEVLSELNPAETNKVTQKQLQKKGFDFEYFTQVYQTKEGKKYHFCYDQGYLLLGDQYVLLVRKHDEI